MHGEFRNTPSFAILECLFLLLARGRRHRWIVIIWLATFVAVTEFCQLGIKTRYFDTNDILLGLVRPGAILGGDGACCLAPAGKYRRIFV